MLKLCRVSKVKVLFLVLVHVCNFNLFEFSAAILEKGLFFCLHDRGKTPVEMTVREAIDRAEAKNIYNSISPNLKFFWVFFCKCIF